MYSSVRTDENDDDVSNAQKIQALEAGLVKMQRAIQALKKEDLKRLKASQTDVSLTRRRPSTRTSKRMDGLKNVWRYSRRIAGQSFVLSTTLLIVSMLTKLISAALSDIEGTDEPSTLALGISTIVIIVLVAVTTAIMVRYCTNYVEDIPWVKDKDKAPSSSENGPTYISVWVNEPTTS